MDDEFITEVLDLVLKQLPMDVVKKLIDKGVRNKLSLMRWKGGKGMEDSLQYWFNTRV